MLAPLYDKFYEFQYQAKANFIRHIFPFSQDDQLVDLGGATAQTSLILKADLKMTRPVVCVDPCKEMLAVAKQNGAITVEASAESFLGSKPQYPLDAVLIIGCFHHFTDPEFVLSSLAQYMPPKGMCLILRYDSPENAFPFFKAAKESFVRPGLTLEQICNLIELNGLNYAKKYGSESVEIKKSLWYDCIRNRFMSSLQTFSDQELEEGIDELEEKFKDQDILRLDLAFEGILITKNKGSPKGCQEKSL